MTDKLQQVLICATRVVIGREGHLQALQHDVPQSSQLPVGISVYGRQPLTISSQPLTFTKLNTSLLYLAVVWLY